MVKFTEMKKAKAAAAAAPMVAVAPPAVEPIAKPPAARPAAAPEKVTDVGSGEFIEERMLTPAPAPSPVARAPPSAQVVAPAKPVASIPPPLPTTGGQVLEVAPGVSSDMLRLARALETKPRFPAVGAATAAAREDSVPDVGNDVVAEPSCSVTDLPADAATLEPSGSLSRPVSTREPPTKPVTRTEMDEILRAAEAAAPAPVPTPAAAPARAPATRVPQVPRAARPQAAKPAAVRTQEKLVGTGFEGQVTSIGPFSITYKGTDATGKQKRFDISVAGKTSSFALGDDEGNRSARINKSDEGIQLDVVNLGDAVKATLKGGTSEFSKVTTTAKTWLERRVEDAKYYLGEIVLAAVNAIAVPLAVTQLEAVQKAPGWMKLLLGVYVAAELAIVAFSVRLKRTRRLEERVRESEIEGRGV